MGNCLAAWSGNVVSLPGWSGRRAMRPAAMSFNGGNGR